MGDEHGVAARFVGADVEIEPVRPIEPLGSSLSALLPTATVTCFEPS